MEEVAEQLVEHEEHLDHAHGFLHDDLLVQLFMSAFRKCTGHSNMKKNDLRFKTTLRLPYFSRKFCHFIMKFLLIVNALYYSMFLTCVVYIVGVSAKGVASIIALLLPLLVNTIVLGPKIVRQFSLVNGTWRVERKKLSGVIEHFIEVQEIKTSMIAQIYLYMRSNEKSLQDINILFTADDSYKNGFIGIDNLRQLLLHEFKFKISRHKFNTLVRLQFRTRIGNVNCTDFLKLIEEEGEYNF